MKRTFTVLIAAALFFGAPLASAVAADMTYEETLKDVEATLGSIPTFIKQMPKAGFAGAWLQLKELEFSGDTALPAKYKALIEFAVVSQIPCQYCIWADTEDAKAEGATDQEIGEAIAVAATGRFWSTMLNGLQVDLATFKAEFSAMMSKEPTK